MINELLASVIHSKAPRAHTPKDPPCDPNHPSALSLVAPLFLWCVLPRDVRTLTHVKINGTHFGVGECTTHFRTYFSRDWDVHRGERDFDPWPYCQLMSFPH